MFAHLGRDPVPAGIMKKRAPRVYRWVERMTAPGLDLVDYPDCLAEFWPHDEIPPTLQPVLRHIAADIFPELTDKLAFLDAWVARRQPAQGEPVTDKPQVRQVGLVETEYQGVPVEVGVEPYLLFVLQRAADLLATLPSAHAQAVMAQLQQLGLAAAIPAVSSYRVERSNNIEVWALPTTG